MARFSAAKRWSDSHKRRILDSRTNGTELIATALAGLEREGAGRYAFRYVFVDDGSTVRLRQEQFRYLAPEEGSDDQEWVVPLILSQEKDGVIEIRRIQHDNSTLAGG